MCIDVLCAYLRMPATPEPAADDIAAHTAWRSMAEVRSTILRLIATHMKADAPIPWHGADLDFTGVVFTTDVNFAQAVFSGGEVSFGGAKFSGSEVSFRGAEFSGGRVCFSGAEFSGSAVDFSRAANWHPAIEGLPERAPGLRRRLTLPGPLGPEEAPESEAGGGTAPPGDAAPDEGEAHTPA